jgi:hypothetical protein
MPPAGRPSPPFIDLGRRLTVVPCGLRYSVAVPVCSTCDLKVVLVNPGPCTRHGGSCACLEAVLRVVLVGGYPKNSDESPNTRERESS